MQTTLRIEVEEFQVDKCVEAELIFDVIPGEPMVRYYADGSGYPGCDPYAELVGIVILKVEDAATGDELPIEEYREAVEAYIYENEYRYAEEAMEDELGY